jgi:hypothetical protein
VLDHLPERDRPAVKARPRQAWKEPDPDRALEQLNTLALELDRAHPGAVASLREGMEETLTVTRLGITGKLKLALQSTNPCECARWAGKWTVRSFDVLSDGRLGRRGNLRRWRRAQRPPLDARSAGRARFMPGAGGT